MEKDQLPISPDTSFAMSQSDLIDRLAVDPQQGLSAAEVQARREQYGLNRLAEEESQPWIVKFINQFKDFMVLVLIVASLVSAFLGSWIEAIAIIAIVIINAILGVFQEGQAEKAVAALQKLSSIKTRLLRDGKQIEVDSQELVPGDVVLLEAGDLVPADIRLVESVNLQAEEASLTGESVPVEKNQAFKAEVDTPLGDRANMLFSGTSVTYGRGVGVVTGTAENTEIGRIADHLKEIKEESSPLQISLNQLGKTLGVLCLAVCAVVFLVGVIRGGQVLDMFMTAVSLAVAAIPEGLTVVVTIVLSLGMKRMAEHHAIVKRLLAVETLGSVDVICSDKTGTLTQNEMTVTNIAAGDRIYELTGVGYAPDGDILLNRQAVAEVDDVTKRVLLISSLCNDAVLQADTDGVYSILGDPTEGALLTAAAKAGVDRAVLLRNYPKKNEMPFDSDRKMMTVFHAGIEEGKDLALTKGAPDIVLERCAFELTAVGERPLTAARKEAIMAINSGFAKKALRVLAFAYSRHQPGSTEGAEKEMVYAGLMGMIDPARPEVKESIRLCRRAGIRPVMITGDHRDTAVAIATELGMIGSGERALTGRELEVMSEEELREAVEETAVYARVSPEHKVRIVSALRKNGHITSMTGDGVNDAPALKQADIGVAMGITGTEVAKSASEMILTDDNFATIVNAVSEGRVIFSNIRKFVSFLLSCNVGEILVVFIITLIMGPEFAPLAPIQLLWLNLVTDSFPALALGQEQAEPDIMDRRPRKKDASIINKEMRLSILVQAVAIFGAVFAAFRIGIGRYPNAADLLGPSHGARTYAFVTLICAELLRAYSCRSEHYSIFSIGFFSNKSMIKASLVSLFLLLVVVYVPFLDPIFGTIFLTWKDWAVIIPLSLIPFVCGELFKVFYHYETRKRLKKIN